MGNESSLYQDLLWNLYKISIVLISYSFDPSLFAQLITRLILFGRLILVQSLVFLHPQMSGVRRCTAHGDLYKISIKIHYRTHYRFS